MYEKQKEPYNALGLLFTVVLFENALILYFAILGYKIPKIGEIVRYSLYAVLLTYSIINYVINRRRTHNNNILTFAYYYLAIITVLIQMFIFSENVSAIMDNIGTLIYCSLVCFWIGTQYNEGITLGKHKFGDALYLLSILGLFASILYSIYSSYINRYEELGLNSDMATAYNVLICICFITKRMVERTTLQNITLFIISVIYLLSLGTRGAVICLIVFLIWSLINANQGKGKAKIFILIGLCAIALLISFFYEQMIEFLVVIYQKSGFSTRTIEKITSGEMFVSDSRNVILDMIKASISERPFFGNGIFADRIIVGTYTHNIFYELWLDFGYFGGTVILILLATLFLRAYKCIRTNDGKTLFMALFCSSIIHLAFSGSYLTEPFFFLLVGISISLVANRSNQNTSFDLLYKSK